MEELLIRLKWNLTPAMMMPLIKLSKNFYLCLATLLSSLPCPTWFFCDFFNLQLHNVLHNLHDLITVAASDKNFRISHKRENFCASENFRTAQIFLPRSRCFFFSSDFSFVEKYWFCSHWDRDETLKFHQIFMHHTRLPTRFSSIF